MPRRDLWGRLLLSAAGLAVNLFVALVFVLLSVTAWWMSVSPQDAPDPARG